MSGIKKRRQFTESEWETYRKEVFKARSRIGQNGDDVMRWLLNFAQTDLSTLSAIDWMKLRYEIACFAGRGAVGQPWHITTWAYFGRGKSLIPVDKEVLQFQNWLKQTIECILGRQSISFEFNSLVMSVVPSYKSGDKGLLGFAPQIDSEESAAQLSFTLYNWLLIYAMRIRQCLKCHKIFISKRKHQQFCSHRCQTQSAMNRYLIRHGLKTGRPRGRPRKEVSLKSKKKGVKHGKRK